MKRNTDQSEVQKELEELSPLLAKLRKQDTGFTVPENYFRDLTGEILQKTVASTTKVKEKRSGGFWSSLHLLQIALRPRYALAMTALALLIVAGLLWLRPATDNNFGKIAWSDISTEEMTRYVESNIQEFDLETLVEIAPDIETQSIFSGTEIEQDVLDQFLEEIIDEVEIEELEDIF